VLFASELCFQLCAVFKVENVLVLQISSRMSSSEEEANSYDDGNCKYEDTFSQSSIRADVHRHTRLYKNQYRVFVSTEYR
jgi:hypothetical protein